MNATDTEAAVVTCLRVVFETMMVATIAESEARIEMVTTAATSKTRSEVDEAAAGCEARREVNVVKIEAGKEVVEIAAKSTAAAGASAVKNGVKTGEAVAMTAHALRTTMAA